MALLSDRIHKMRLGTWSHPIPVEQDDEMGKLLREFNELGPELSLTAHQYAAASKLAAMLKLAAKQEPKNFFVFWEPARCGSRM
jgi:hypothetical protein